MAIEISRAGGDQAPGALERSGGGLDKVSRDLAALLEGADLGATGETKAPRQPKLHAVRRTAPPSERRFAVAGGVAAAALAGIAAGALLAQGHPIHLVHPAAPLVAPAAPVQELAAPPASSWDDSMITYAPSRRTAAKLEAGAEVTSTRPAKLARIASRAAKAARLRQTQSRCASHGRHGRGACQQRMLRAADARLRRAYAQAIRAHVPRPLLLSYRSDWAQLRQQAVRSPEQTAAAYDRLARDLVRQARPGLRRRR